MIIRLFNSDQYFDLPEGIQFSVELNSPFFSEQGSLTLPVKLPDTPHNRKLFGHANRLDVVTSGATDRVITTDLAVIVAVGSWQQHATLSLISYSSEGFECTLLFSESNIYSRLRNLTLKDALSDIVWTPADGRCSLATDSPTRTTPAALLSCMSDWLRNGNAASDDFAAFPVMADEGILNSVSPQDDRPVSEYSSGDIHCYEAGAEPYTPFKINDSYVRLSDDQALGFTVFLKLHVVLELIFARIGKTLTYEFPTGSNLLTEAMFKRIVILNSTIDTFAPGMIYYSTLVPKTGVPDFLQSLFAMFGMSFFETSPDTVKVCFLQHCLTGKAPRTIDSAVFNSVTYADRQDLSIAFNHLRADGDSEINSVEDLVKAGFTVPDPILCNSDVDRHGGHYNVASPDPGIMRVHDRGEIWNMTRPVNSSGGRLYLGGMVCYDQFNLLPDEEFTVKELANVISDSHPSDTYLYLTAADEAIPDSLPWLGDFPAVRVGPVNAETTELKITATDSEGNDTQVSVGVRDEQPLLLCYYYSTMFDFQGRWRYDENGMGKGNILMSYGLPYCLDLIRRGQTRAKADSHPEHDLTATGMAATMHEAYRKALREGMHTVDVTLMLTQYQIFSFDFSQPLLVENRKYMPLAIKAAVTDNPEAPLIPVELQLLAV